MATQITKQEVKETIAQMLNCKVSDIKNIDMENETFQRGNSVSMFKLTPKKTMVKANSFVFLYTVSDNQNCIAGA